MKDLVKKLITVQSKLRAPKAQRNNFGNYNYRSCEDILEALKPLLAEQSLLLSIEDEIVQVGERYYIKATVLVTDGTDQIKSSALAREALDKKGMDESQITGAASSYARKYALNGMFAIDDTQDADATNNHEKKEPKEDKPVQLPKATQKQVDLIKKLCGEKGEKIPNFELLTMDQAKRYIDQLINGKPANQGN